MRFRISVVLPEPKKPVKMVTGVPIVGVGSGRFLGEERVEWELEQNLATIRAQRQVTSYRELQRFKLYVKDLLSISR